MTLLCPEPWWAILHPFSTFSCGSCACACCAIFLSIGTIILRVLAVQFSGHRWVECACVCVRVCCVVCSACPHSITPLLPLLPPLAHCIVITIMARTIYVLILHLSGQPQPARPWPRLHPSLTGVYSCGLSAVLTSVWLALITVQLMRKLYLFFQHLLPMPDALFCCC